MPRPTSTPEREIQTFRAALRQLERSLARLAPLLTAAASTDGKRSRRNLQLTPARRGALKLQGQYMGYMRGLKPRQKAEIKRIREAKGIRAAIAAARRLASS